MLTAAPGLSPVEVENLVTYPIETAMMGLPSTQGVRSLSKAGISIVTVTFEDDVEIFFARAQVQQRMQEAAEQPPRRPAPDACARRPRRWARSSSISSSPTRSSLMEFNNLQEYTIEPLLRTIPGVADVNSWGGMVQQFHVDIDPQSSHRIRIDVRRRGASRLREQQQLRSRLHRESRRAVHHPRDRTRDERSRHRRHSSSTTRGGGRRSPCATSPRVTIGPMPREGAVSRDGRGEALAGKIIMLKGSNGREVVRLWKRG